MELCEPFEARTFENQATSDLFEELTIALASVPEGARVRWSGVSVGCLFFSRHLAWFVPCRLWPQAEADNFAARRRSRESTRAQGRRPQQV